MIALRGIALAIAWSLASGLAAAQSCPGVRIDTGSQQPRCIQPGSGEVFRDCPDCPEMVAVPAGDFILGAPADEVVTTKPEDQVRVSIAKPFAVGRFAVTRGEFAAFVAKQTPVWTEMVRESGATAQ
jgi:formylglycine-generating enzyme required for sulfatase activity